ncbi:hypothetical protein M3152_12155 [Sporosarcina luteola]|uniref:hypothetical protein n=1 Tax=Sporosarcina luteola TaxID=582850 RepID=UPI002041DCC2|nr:hypothetical protein [Sporosarcina luteola]MCM3638454.1 hypothetical protein [Sporosarcina luteola]
MKRFIPLVIVALFTQLLAIIIWGEYVWLSKIAVGFSVGGTPLGHIQPALWIAFVIEIILLAIYFKKNE